MVEAVGDRSSPLLMPVKKAAVICVLKEPTSRIIFLKLGDIRYTNDLLRCLPILKREHSFQC